MYGLLCVTLLVSVFALVYYASPASGYDDVDNNFSYENLAKNRTGLKIHLDCFMGTGPCDPTAEHYKSHIMDAVWNGCKFCSKPHMHNAHMFLAGVMKQFPEEYKEFKRMYDKEGSHFQTLEDQVDKY